MIKSDIVPPLLVSYSASEVKVKIDKHSIQDKTIIFDDLFIRKGPNQIPNYSSKTKNYNDKKYQHKHDCLVHTTDFIMVWRPVSCIHCVDHPELQWNGMEDLPVECQDNNLCM